MSLKQESKDRPDSDQAEKAKIEAEIAALNEQINRSNQAYNLFSGLMIAATIPIAQYSPSSPYASPEHSRPIASALIDYRFLLMAKKLELQTVLGYLK